MIKLAALALGVVGIILFAVVLSLPTMFFWDYLMPDIFGLPKITIVQAFSMNVLAGILFRSKK